MPIPDTTVNQQKSYEYRLSAVDTSGKESNFSQAVDTAPPMTPAPSPNQQTEKIELAN